NHGKIRVFFFSSRRRHTSFSRDWSSDVCSSDLLAARKNEWFTEYIHKMKPDELFPGVRELFARLRSENIKIGLASSSKNAQTIRSEERRVGKECRAQRA